MLPKLDGLEVCKQLRARSTVPIIMLTARDDELDKVLGLELGADDYVTKPFSIREFRSRMRALLRRAQAPRPRTGRRRGRAADRGSTVSWSTCSAGRSRWTDGAVQLTYVEFELLRELAAQPGRVYSRRMLLEALWGSADFRDPRTIDVHVRHLREKLERDSRNPEFILTVRSVGYRFRRPVNPLRTVGGRLALALLLVVGGALAIVYLVVVPSYQRSLVNAGSPTCAGGARSRRSRAAPDEVFPSQTWIEDEAAAEPAVGPGVVVFSAPPLARPVADSNGGTSLTSSTTRSPLGRRAARRRAAAVDRDGAAVRGGRARRPGATCSSLDPAPQRPRARSPSSAGA